jgi:hypothetical protein
MFDNEIVNWYDDQVSELKKENKLLKEELDNLKGHLCAMCQTDDEEMCNECPAK